VTTSWEYVWLGTLLARARPVQGYKNHQYFVDSVQRIALTKVCEFEFPKLTDQEVLRLDVAVEDPSLMAVAQAPQQLEQEQLRVPGAQPTRVSLHVLTQISVLKNSFYTEYDG
jgi:hypothetical protein